MGYAENGDWFSSYSGANIDNLLGCGKINLIDNAYFGYDPFPINQQGQTSYTKTNGDICIDRWKQYSGTVSILGNALSITSPAAGVVMSQKLSDGACAICRTYGGCSLSVVGHADHPEKWWVRLSTDGTKLYFPELIPGYSAGCATTAVVSSSSTNNIVLEIGVDNPSGGDFLLLRAIKLEPITSILGQSQTLYVIEDSGNGPVAIEKNVPNYDEELVRCTMNEGFTPLVGKGINLLDNAYFIGGGTGYGVFPVNQRGDTTGYVGSKYGIDRWWMSAAGGTVTPRADGLEIAYTGTNCAFFQFFRDGIIIPGNQYTGSLLFSNGTLLTGTAVASNDGSYTEFARNANIAFGIRKFTKNNVLRWCFVFANITTATIKVVAAKLELGSQQTLARKVGSTWVLNDPPPNYQQELAKCKAYLFGVNGVAKTNACVGIGVGNTTARALVSIEVPNGFDTSLIGSGSLVTRGSLRLTPDFVVGHDIPVTSIGFIGGAYNSDTKVLLNVGASAVEVGKWYYLAAANDSNAQILISVEP